MKNEIVLLGCPVDDLEFVADKVSEIISFELYEMSNERYGDVHFSANMQKLISRFGEFPGRENTGATPDVNVFPRINTRYGHINDKDLGEYPVGISLVWISEIETLLQKLLADPELKPELLKTWPTG